MNAELPCPCPCGSGLIGQYEQDENGLVIAFACSECRITRLKKAVAEEQMRAIARVYKWWRDPLLLHKMKRKLIEGGFTEDERWWRVNALLYSSKFFRLPREYEKFFERS